MWIVTTLCDCFYEDLLILDFQMTEETQTGWVIFGPQWWEKQGLTICLYNFLLIKASFFPTVWPEAKHVETCWIISALQVSFPCVPVNFTPWFLGQVLPSLSTSPCSSKLETRPHYTHSNILTLGEIRAVHWLELCVSCNPGNRRSKNNSHPM